MNKEQDQEQQQEYQEVQEQVQEGSHEGEEEEEKEKERYVDPRESVNKVLGYMGKNIRVTMSDGRLLTGTLICFDQRMNVLLNSVTEERPITLPDGTVSYDSAHLGSCIISKKYWTKIELVKESNTENKEGEEKRE